MRILIVEENESLLKLYQELFKKSSYEFTWIDNGFRTLRTLSESCNYFDAVVLDYDISLLSESLKLIGRMGLPPLILNSSEPSRIKLSKLYGLNSFVALLDKEDESFIHSLRSLIYELETETRAKAAYLH